MNGKGDKNNSIKFTPNPTAFWFFLLIAVVAAVAVYNAGQAPVAQPRVLHNDMAKDAGDDAMPAIAHGKGQWIVAWHSDSDLKGGTSADSDILFARSSDGKGWSKPQRLANNPELSKGNDMAPSIATDGAGNWAVAWESTVPTIKAFNTTLTIKDDRDLLIADSTDNGASWKNLHPLNRNAEDDSPGYYSGGADKTKAEYDGDVQLLSDGNYWVAVWTGESRVLNVAGSGCGDYMEPTNIYTQYTQSLFSGSGSTWWGPSCFGNSGADRAGHAATDGKGHWVNVWSSEGNAANTNLGKDSDILTGRAPDSLGTKPTPANWWTGQTHVAAYATTDGVHDYDSDPAIATDGKGLWLAAWSSRVANLTVGGASLALGGNDDDLLLASSTDKGQTWTLIGVLNSNATSDSGNDTEVQLATNGNGKWIAVWQSTEPLGGTGTDADILIAKSSDNGGSWTAPAPLANNANSDKGTDSYPRIANSGSQWVVVWQSDEHGGSGPDSDILFASLTF